MNLHIIICIILVLIIIYLIPKHKLDQKIVEKNQQLDEENKRLLAEVAKNETETKYLEDRKSTLQEDILQISATADATANEMYNKAYSLMQEKMSQAAEYESSKFQNAKKQAEQEYLKAIKQYQADFSASIEAQKEEAVKLQNKINDLKTKTHAAIEADKRRFLEEQEKDYFKIIIPEEELADIQILREVANKLNKDPLPVNKIIWELYYKQPTLKLLGRITPTGKTHTGIYKITNIKTGECYIGQSTDLRNRIRDHVKAGLNIDSSSNKFYTEMKKIGPENFTYEIIEECERSLLNERERYWIEFYESLDFGYNTSRGVSK